MSSSSSATDAAFSGHAKPKEWDLSKPENYFPWHEELKTELDRRGLGRFLVADYRLAPMLSIANCLGGRPNHIVDDDWNAAKLKEWSRLRGGREKLEQDEDSKWKVGATCLVDSIWPDGKEIVRVVNADADGRTRFLGVYNKIGSEFKPTGAYQIAISVTDLHKVTDDLGIISFFQLVHTYVNRIVAIDPTQKPTSETLVRLMMTNLKHRYLRQYLLEHKSDNGVTFDTLETKFRGFVRDDPTLLNTKEWNTVKPVTDPSIGHRNALVHAMTAEQRQVMFAQRGACWNCNKPTCTAKTCDLKNPLGQFVCSSCGLSWPSKSDATYHNLLDCPAVAAELAAIRLKSSATWKANKPNPQSQQNIAGAKAKDDKALKRKLEKKNSDLINGAVKKQFKALTATVEKMSASVNKVVADQVDDRARMSRNGVN